MGDFDYSFGSDPFGGGFEGLAQMVPSTSGLSVEDPNMGVGSSSFIPDMSQYGAAPSGGVLDTVKQAGSSLGAGVKDVLSPFADVAKAALPLVGLGVAGTSMATNIAGAKQAAQNTAIQRRAQRMRENIAGQQSAAAAPLTQFGQKQLDASTKGAIPDSIQAQIDQWAQGAKARVNDYFARSGQGNSLQLQQKLAEIDQAAKAMAGTFLQEEQRLGVNSLAMGANALGGAGNTASTIGQTAGAGNASIAALMQEANRALAQLNSAAA